MEQNSRTVDHYAHLDGLRGMASSFVVFHHAWQACFGAGTLAGALAVFNWLLYGHLAVDVFIVISGFCLTLPLVRSGVLLPPSVSRFFKGRARRILPPYFAMLAIAIAMAVAARAFFGTRSGLPFEAKHVVANALLLQDFFPSLNIFNLALWSVALEFHIYLFFPALFAVALRCGVVVLSVVGAVAGYGLTLLVQRIDPAMDLSKSCIWYLALFVSGMVAAIRLRQPKAKDRSGVIALAFGVLAAVLIKCFPITEAGEAERFRVGLPYIDGAVGISAAAFLLWSTRCVEAGKRNVAVAVMSSRGVVFVGSFAYSLYLVHFPLFQYLKQGLLKGAHIGPGVPFALIFFAVCVPLAYVIAYAFFRFFERPFMSQRLQRNEQGGSERMAGAFRHTA